MIATLKLMSCDAIKAVVTIIPHSQTDVTDSENPLDPNGTSFAPGFGRYYYRAALTEVANLRYSLSGMESDPLIPDPLSQMGPPVCHDGNNHWTTLPPHSLAFSETLELFYFGTGVKVVGTTPKWLWNAGLTVSIPSLHNNLDGTVPGRIPVRIVNHNPFPARLYLLNKGIIELAFYAVEVE